MAIGRSLHIAILQFPFLLSSTAVQLCASYHPGKAGEVWALHYAATVVLSNAFNPLSPSVSMIQL